MAAFSGNWRRRLSSPVLLASVLTGLVAGAVLLLSSLGYASAGGAGPAPSQYQYQCKQDGYKNFDGSNGSPGPFKNQGDCVSFFNTGN
jgi:hypothetical protein